MNVNKVLLGGRLTRDVELKRAGETPLAVFGIAINRTFKTRDGEKREDVVFVDCEAWGRTAETIHQYVKKGDPLFVEGRLRFSQWDQDGQRRSRLTVTVETFQFVGSKETAKA